MGNNDTKLNRYYMYNWNHIRSFLAVVDTGTLSGAAEKLGVSQPTLGRNIEGLETSLGLILFSRGRMGMALTADGLELVENAKEISNLANQLELKAEGKASSVAGTVRITASVIVSAYILPKILSAFREEEPDIDIEIFPTDHIQNLLSRDADIAIRMMPLQQNNLIGRKVNEMALGTYVHQDYIMKHGQPRDYSELFSYDVIGEDRGNLVLNRMEQYGVKGGRELFSFRTDDQIAYWELVKAGAGIGFGACFLARRTPELIPILPELNLSALPMWIAAHQEVKTSLKIRRTVDYLTETISKLDFT